MELIQGLVEAGHLHTPEIIRAFQRVRRRDFLPAGKEPGADIDAPVSIGYGQTNSQPYTVAFMLELLAPQPGNVILDVGSGSGWTTALLADIAGEAGRVFGLEAIDELKKFGEKNAAKYNFVASGRARFFTGNGYQGLPEYAPFDRINVSAAADRIPPALLIQLKVGGRLIMPVSKDPHNQSLILLEKISAGEYKQKEFPGFVFVPLIK